MNSVNCRKLPLFIEWMDPQGNENPILESPCEKITKIFLVAIEALLLVVANVVTLANVNWIPGVFEEEKILCQYLFCEKTVTIIPTNSPIQDSDTDDEIKEEIPPSNLPIQDSDADDEIKEEIPSNPPILPDSSPEEKSHAMNPPTLPTNNAPSSKPNRMPKMAKSAWTIHHLNKTLLLKKKRIVSTSSSTTASSSTSKSVKKTANTINTANPVASKSVIPTKKSTQETLIKTTKSFDGLSTIEISRIQTIKNCMNKMGPAEKEKLETLKNQFLTDIKKAQLKALDLHQSFLKTCSGKDTTQFSPTAGITVSTIFQFKEAVKLAKEQFPGLMALSFTPELKLEVAKLIQIIMCGEAAQTAEIKNLCCFQFKELRGKCSAEINVLEELTEGHYLLELLKNKNEEVAPFQAFVNAFQQLCEKQKDLPALLNDIGGEIYKNNRKLSQEDFPKYISRYQNSPLVIALENNILQILEDATKTVLDDFRKKQRESSSINGPRYENEIEALEDFEWEMKHGGTSSTMKEFTQELNCTKEDLLSLIRIFFLQAIILRSSSSTSRSENIFNDILKGYPEPAQFNSTSSSTQSIFSLDKIDIQSTRQLSIGVESYIGEGIQEHFNETVAIAQITSKEELSNLHENEKTQSKKIVPISELSVSWQIPGSVLDYLASQIDPNVTENQGINNKIETKELQANRFRDIEYFKLQRYRLHKTPYSLIYDEPNQPARSLSSLERK